jgi:hypothetical protein
MLQSTDIILEAVAVNYRRLIYLHYCKLVENAYRKSGKKENENGSSI